MERENNEDDRDRPTVTIHREALLGLIDQSNAAPPPRAHTVPRDELRSRAVTRNDSATAQMAPLDPAVEPDDDESPLPPLLVLAVIAVLLVAFIASTQLR